MKEKANYPICEVCGKEPATSFSWFRDHDVPISQPNGQWKLAGACTSGIEAYYIEFRRFFESKAETAGWLAHMNGKSWMDWRDFANMMRRFSSAMPRAVQAA